jgi:hypothetical protein
LKKTILKVHLEAQKTTSSQGKTEQKRAMLEVSQYLIQIIFQGHSNKNSMVLAQKQL